MLSMPDHTLNHQMGGLLHSAITSFYEANAALWGFNTALDALWADMEVDTFDADRDRHRVILESLEAQFGENDNHSDLAHLMLNREKWEAGRLPTAFIKAFPQIHAHGFLFSLDALGKYLGVIAKHPQVSGVAQDAAKRFEAELPEVRQIRNSAQHREDRIRGLKQGNTPLPEKEIDAFGVSAPAGNTVVMAHLSDNTLAYTNADGEVIGLDVTTETLILARDILQAVLDAFPWRGSTSYYPR